VSTFLPASGAWRRNCPKRSPPAFSVFTTIGFHLPSITSIAGLTGQSESRISHSGYKIVPTGFDRSFVSKKELQERTSVKQLAEASRINEA